MYWFLLLVYLFCKSILIFQLGTLHVLVEHRFLFTNNHFFTSYTFMLLGNQNITESKEHASAEYGPPKVGYCCLDLKCLQVQHAIYSESYLVAA